MAAACCIVLAKCAVTRRSDCRSWCKNFSLFSLSRSFHVKIKVIKVLRPFVWFEPRHMEVQLLHWPTVMSAIPGWGWSWFQLHFASGKKISWKRIPINKICTFWGHGTMNSNFERKAYKVSDICNKIDYCSSEPQWDVLAHASDSCYKRTKGGKCWGWCVGQGASVLCW